jgi:uncharacterized protein YpuA (DUF1002 family)
MDVLGTLYGFLSVLTATVGLIVLVFVVMRQLIKGKASANLGGNTFMLGQDKSAEALDEIKASLDDLRNYKSSLEELRASVDDMRNGRFAQEQSKANMALDEIKEQFARLREDIKEDIKEDIRAIQLDLWELQIRNPGIHIVQRAEIFGRYEAKGGKNKDLAVYYEAVVKPLLEKYYREQSEQEQ